MRILEYFITTFENKKYTKEKNNNQPMQYDNKVTYDI